MRKVMNGVDLNRFAKEMALAVNGGDWDKDYTEAQREGWRLKAKFAVEYLNTRA